MVSRGDIWLVNLNPVKKNNEVGKVCPALVLQSDELNAGAYPTSVILPISTQLIDDAEPLRYRVKAQDKLQQDSDVLIAQIRSIDNSRFIEKLTHLSLQETNYIKSLLDEVLS
ncbi:type II toxin-antitoxin system PemK/MazF family toxin [Sulfurimonas sp.]|uniref:type II toxin-antitoxin system PemK/MazF family toxin n=1 Tax=Sulfurimonas sp. TaxID=2022749 RepID=UPI00262252CD|nr:type II toxin-antitoxin system PemK/MazF family toxin [Sulfurimonas sp.]